MAKKKSERRQQKAAVRIEGVLESVTDELAAVIGVLRAAPEMSPGEPDEIAEWAKVLKVRLEGLLAVVLQELPKQVVQMPDAEHDEVVQTLLLHDLDEPLDVGAIRVLHGKGDKSRTVGICVLGQSIGVPTQALSGHLIRQTNYLLGDANPSTWQSLSTQAALPANTSYIAVSLDIVENVFNDLAPPEFDGHYVDDVELTIDAPCASDVDANGEVDIDDLFDVINDWGHVPERIRQSRSPRKARLERRNEAGAKATSLAAVL